MRNHSLPQLLESAAILDWTLKGSVPCDLHLSTVAAAEMAAAEEAAGALASEVAAEGGADVGSGVSSVAAPATCSISEFLDVDEDVLDHAEGPGTATLLGSPGRRSHRSQSKSVSPPCRGGRARPGTGGASSGGGGSSVGKAKKKAKKPTKGMRQCRACKGMLDTDSAKTDQWYCPDDNRALDRIYYMAKTLGESSKKWFHECRRDENKTKEMLDNYWAKFGGRSKWKSKTPTGTKWSMASYMESVKVTTGVEKETQGKLMWRAEYFEFAASARGGKLSDEEAQSNWNSWVAKYDTDSSDPTISWDLDGPKKAPLQFRVIVGKCVNVINKYHHEKKTETQQKLSKDSTAEELQKYRMHSMTGHENISAAGSSNVDFDGMARDMARQSTELAGGTFSADTQRFGSAEALEALCKDTEQDTELEEEEVDDKEGSVKATDRH